MTTDIANLSNFGSNTLSKADTGGAIEEFNEKLQQGVSSFLPRIQLAVEKSEICRPKEAGGKEANVGSFYLVQGSDSALTELGKSFDGVVCAPRMKALEWRKGWAREVVEPHSEFIESGGDKEAFDLICSKEKVKDPDGTMRSWGPEFLVWLNDFNRFALLFCGGWTARKTALDDIYAHYKVCAPLTCNMTFQSKYLTKTKFPRYAYFATPCSTAPANVPDPELLQSMLHDFRNPTITNVAVADTEEQEEDR